MQWKTVLVSMLGILGFGSGPAGAAQFDRIVVFGDSLSDSGNAGRFSNGPVWVEQRQLGLDVRPSDRGGSNFAIGGARLNPGSGPTSLGAQVDRYLASPPAAIGILHIVFGGGKDLLAAVLDPRAELMVDIAAASLGDIITRLVDAGATEFIVPNLPDVGMTPAIMSRGKAAQEHAQRLTERFNAEIDRMLTEVESHRRPIRRLDVHAMAERARSDPASYGFAEVMTPSAALASCDGYLFWDHVHPTERGHARLADAAWNLLLGPHVDREADRPSP